MNAGIPVGIAVLLLAAVFGLGLGDIDGSARKMTGLTSIGDLPVGTIILSQESIEVFVLNN
jgi:hypothetical protein